MTSSQGVRTVQVGYVVGVLLSDLKTASRLTVRDFQGIEMPTAGPRRFQTSRSVLEKWSAR